MNLEKEPIAVVLGDIDLLRPLVLGKVPCAVVADHGDLPFYSRYASAVIEWADAWKEPEKLVERLVEFARKQKSKPVLFYESDAELLMISRYRKRLSEFYRFVITDAELVEELVDKALFLKLAQKHSLPIPPTRFLFENVDSSINKPELKFPVIVKPLTRRVSEWSPIAGLSKAIKINSAEELDNFRKRFAQIGFDFLVQEMILGAESSIESYHVYVDENKVIVGEFTGKKIRTYPKDFGQSCALTLTDAEDVAELGRGILKRLNFRGLAKFDFKRSPEGKLYLLEINPRFNLWHHLGAVAGVNLPLAVYNDLVGIPRNIYGKAEAGVYWCRLWQDIFMARADGMPLIKWLFWSLKCRAKSGLYLDDPYMIFGAGFWRTTVKLMPKFMKQKNIRIRASKIQN